MHHRLLVAALVIAKVEVLLQRLPEAGDVAMSAYEDAISNTSTPYAPWYVVPANKKWYRDLVISTVIVNTLKGLKMGYPKPESDLSKIAIQ